MYIYIYIICNFKLNPENSEYIINIETQMNTVYIRIKIASEYIL